MFETRDCWLVSCFAAATDGPPARFTSLPASFALGAVELAMLYGELCLRCHALHSRPAPAAHGPFLSSLPLTQGGPASTCSHSTITTVRRPSETISIYQFHC